MWRSGENAGKGGGKDSESKWRNSQPTAGLNPARTPEPGRKGEIMVQIDSAGALGVLIAIGIFITFAWVYVAFYKDSWGGTDGY